MTDKIHTMIPRYWELNRIYRDYIDNRVFSFDRQKFISLEIEVQLDVTLVAATRISSRKWNIYSDNLFDNNGLLYICGLVKPILQTMKNECE